MDVDAHWFEDEVWQGFLPTESRSALLERHVFQTYVAGLRYFPDARDDPTFVPGSPLTLTPDPDNAWDPNAIAVWNEGSTLQAGHIPAHIAVGLDPRRDRTALALYEQMEAGLRVNLGVLISREPLTLHRVPDTVERAAWAARRSRSWRPSSPKGASRRSRRAIRWNRCVAWRRTFADPK